MTTNVRYVAKGRLIMADLGGVTIEPVGMMDSDQLAALAAAGMNRMLAGQRLSRPTPGEHLTPGTDFRDPNAQTAFLPVYGQRRN